MQEWAGIPNVLGTNQKNYFDSEEFKKDFQEHPDYYIKDYNGEKTSLLLIDR